MGEKNDNIDKILEEFENQRKHKNALPNLPTENANNRSEKIDFAKSKKDLAREKRERKRNREKQRKKIKVKKPDLKRIFTKKFFIALGALALAAVVTTASVFAVNQSKTAYLKPYREKYPNVEFPEGIMEKYCDLYGKNQFTDGFIEMNDLSYKSPVLSDSDGKLPYREQSAKNTRTFNYVVYMPDNSIERFYSSARAYNSSCGYIRYSDLFCDYNFMVVGAFYTNTKASDDDGYIFPYNVTEVMTDKSYSDYIDRLNSRFIYDTGITITRKDKLLTLSCPTDYRKDFRFVVTAVMRDNTHNKPSAVQKENIRLPQIIYDETKKDNPYKYSKKWYPQIIINDLNENETVSQQTIKDYA